MKKRLLSVILKKEIAFISTCCKPKGILLKEE